jgi:hypothetical protein
VAIEEADHPPMVLLPAVTEEVHVLRSGNKPQVLGLLCLGEQGAGFGLGGVTVATSGEKQ